MLYLLGQCNAVDLESKKLSSNQCCIPDMKSRVVAHRHDYDHGDEYNNEMPNEDMWTQAAEYPIGGHRHPLSSSGNKMARLPLQSFCKHHYET